MAKDKNSFVLYTNYIDTIETLTNEQAGMLFKHIMKYVNDLNPEEPTDMVVKVAWVGIKRQLKDDLKKYEDKRNQLRANANKKYEKHTNNSVCMQMDANATKCSDLHYVNDNVNVNVNDNDNVYVEDNKKITNIEDNIEREIENTYTHEYIIELINIIKEHYPTELTYENEIKFKEQFINLLSRYSISNIRKSTYHALTKLLEKECVDNPLGYLWNSISINCEQFKN